MMSNQNNVAKSKLYSTKIEDNDKSLGASLWIPKAKEGRNRPNVCLTLSIHEDKLKLYCENTNQLKTFLQKLTEFFYKHEKELAASLEEERRNWYKYREAITKIKDEEGIV